MKKIWKWIKPFITLGFSLYMAWRKNAKKLEAMMIGVHHVRLEIDTLRKNFSAGQISGEEMVSLLRGKRIKEILMSVQQTSKVSNEIAEDLGKLYLKGIIQKIRE